MENSVKWLDFIEKMKQDAKEELARTGREQSKNSCLVPPHATPTPEMRVAANRVLFRCDLSPSTGCANWIGAKTKSGYGRIKLNGKLVLAHRVVAVAAGIARAVSNPDENDYILHSCDNPSCCNPAHLRSGTLLDNMADCSRRGRLRSQKR